MLYKILKLGVFLTLAFFLGCEANSSNGTNNWKKDAPFYHGEYVDFESFKEGRLCSEVRFTCLTESQDKLVVDTPLENGLDSFELTSEVMEKYHAIIKRWRDEEDGLVKDESMKAAELSEAFFDKVEEKKFLKEMEAQLEKEFPGFWKDTPKQVRYRWIQRAMNKAKVFGHTSKQPGSMVELCARIGLDFDKDPKWEAITEYVHKDPKNHISRAINYIDWTVFEKTHARTGTRITDWLMRGVHPALPYPKKPYPRLND
jgi:hypothetical protein